MTFYKTVITVEVLSEGPLQWNDLSDVAYEIIEGGASGWIDYREEDISEEDLIQECKKHATDPEFFLGYLDN